MAEKLKSVKSERKTKKKEYHKPEIVSEKVFETAALACGKCIAGNPIFTGDCPYVPRLS
ncbi:MAG: hypothetical protein QME68_08620 [Elusimicrobiota bacterium]|nr:hypothetical protein [Elusimicrobiota bacterium]